MSEKELRESIVQMSIDIDRLTGDRYNYMTIAELREELLKYKNREIVNTEQLNKTLYTDNVELEKHNIGLQQENHDLSISIKDNARIIKLKENHIATLDAAIKKMRTRDK